MALINMKVIGVSLTFVWLVSFKNVANAENASYSPMFTEIYWANLEVAIRKEMIKERPTRIVQPDRVTKISSDTFLIVPLSSDLRPRPIESLGIKLLRIKARDRLQSDSIFLIDQLRTISPQWFGPPGFLTQLTSQEMKIVQTGISMFVIAEIEASNNLDNGNNATCTYTNLDHNFQAE